MPDSHPPKKLAVSVTYNGITKSVDANPEESVTALLQAAIKQFVVTEQHHLLALFNEGGVEITNEARSVEDAGVTDGSRLVLRQSAVKGG